MAAKKVPTSQSEQSFAHVGLLAGVAVFILAVTLAAWNLGVL
ncbi:hypothetical protein [Cystobacter fuscus]